MRMGLKVALGTLLVTAAAGAVAFGPVVRAEARSQAARRGIALTIGAVRPGWGRVWMSDLGVKLDGVPALEVHLRSVEVDLSTALSVKRVVAHGGSVLVRGALSDVAAQLGRWRDRHAGGGGISGGAGGGKAYSADGMHVVWRGLSGSGDGGELWGAGYSRDTAGHERLAADLARLVGRGAALRVRGGRVELARQDGHRVLRRVVADAVVATLDLDDGALRHVLVMEGRSASGGGASGGGASRGVEPAAARRGPGLRALFSRLVRAAGAILPVGGKLDLDGLRLRLRHNDQKLNVGPLRLHLGRDAKRVDLDLVPDGDAAGARPRGTPLRLRLEAPLGDGPVEIALQGGPVSLAVLGVQEGDLGLVDVDRAELEAKLHARLSAGGRTLAFTGRGRLDKLSLERRWLSPHPVRGIELSWRGRGEAALDGTRLHIDEGELDFGKVRMQARGELERGRGYLRLRLDGGIPLASCQSMLDSSPEGLTPLLTGMRMSGTFSLQGHVDLDTRHPGEMVARWKVQNECRITAVPAAVSPRRFESRWVRRVKGAGGRSMTIESGPGSPGWAPGARISPFMRTAVLVCEDAHFWSHHGFDEQAIRDSIRDNFKAGKFVRGASTISMQLAKNLYLSRRKTLSRKMQEAVLTMLLEQELTKEQIMELYLNVIEFGPGIYGIGPAAQHYFDTTADQLSLGQSLYLASILPDPRIQHFGPGGQVTPGWSAYLRKLMHIAHKIRRITDDELAEGLSEQVAFGVPYLPRRGDVGMGMGMAGQSVPEPGNLPVHDEATTP